MKYPRKLKHRTPLGMSVKGYEEARKKNLKKGWWACHCGSRTFHLLQQKENVKSICSCCGEMDILYWNGQGDSSSGDMRRLDTNIWIKEDKK